NSTIVLNTATKVGGGIAVANIEASDTITLDSTIVALNKSNGVDNDIDAVSGSPATINAFSSFLGVSDNAGLQPAGGTWDGSNHLGKQNSPADPLIGGLRLNGGLTPTHALLKGSLAIDAGRDQLSLPSDQRDGAFVRAYSPTNPPIPDIGAYELQ